MKRKLLVGLGIASSVFSALLVVHFIVVHGQRSQLMRAPDLLPDWLVIVSPLPVATFSADQYRTMHDRDIRLRVGGEHVACALIHVEEAGMLIYDVPPYYSPSRLDPDVNFMLAGWMVRDNDFVATAILRIHNEYTNLRPLTSFLGGFQYSTHGWWFRDVRVVADGSNQVPIINENYHYVVADPTLAVCLNVADLHPGDHMVMLRIEHHPDPLTYSWAFRVLPSTVPPERRQLPTDAIIILVALLFVVVARLAWRRLRSSMQANLSQ